MSRILRAVLALAVALGLVLVASSCASSSRSGLPAPTATASAAVCPPISGTAGPTHMGPERLGSDRSTAIAAAAQAKMPAASRGRQYQIFFCPHAGIRVGLASRTLIGYMLAAGILNARGYLGRVVWISTSSDLYSIDGIVAGAIIAPIITPAGITIGGSVSALHGRLPLSAPETVGANDWYYGLWDGCTIVLKTSAHQDVVQEFGVAYPWAGRLLARTFMQGTFD